MSRLSADDQYASDATRGVFVVDRTIAIGPVNLLVTSMTSYRHKLIFMPSRTSTSHDLFDLRADDVPDLFPHREGRFPQGARMPLRADRLPVRVVLEAGAFLAPKDKHRVPSVEHKAYRGA